MKRLATIIFILLAVSFIAGCSGSGKAVKPAGVAGDISVLSLGADTAGLTNDQIALLQRTIDWMDRDIIISLTRYGFNAVHIDNEESFQGTENSHLLKIAITDHKMVPKGARIWGGMMAGADRLNAHYDLVDAGGNTVLTWDDVQASTKGGNYCAQSLNRNVAKKVSTFLDSH